MMCFGQVADAYEEGRLGYPERLVDDVLDYAGPGCRNAVEVGAGTGKASVQFAARGLELLCLEPDPRMAATLTGRCRSYPGVRVHVARFEDWSPSLGYDLLVSAQAWHWVDPRMRWDGARAALGRGGTLALFWHYYSVAEPRLRDALRRVNARSGLRELNQMTLADLPPVPDEDPEAEPWIELRADDRFAGQQTRRYHAEHVFTSRRYCQLISSLSAFRLAQRDQREGLLDATGEVIAGHGGQIELTLVTDLLLARNAVGPG